jgi:two-component system chemotaxis response regulator CheB
LAQTPSEPPPGLVPESAAPDGLRRVVAFGASAGGLAALRVIMAALPADLPAALLIVLHLSPDFVSRIADILGRHTALRVKEAQQGDRLRAGWVYVAPPGRHLLACADGTVSLTLTEKVHHCRPSVDVLLTSVAASFGPRSVGVVLTGGDGDGASGIQAIRAAGGVTIAQDLPSSLDPSMPRSAAQTGDVDCVLPLAEIAPALLALLDADAPPDPGRPSTPRGPGCQTTGATGEIGRPRDVTPAKATRSRHGADAGGVTDPNEVELSGRSQRATETGKR